MRFIRNVAEKLSRDRVLLRHLPRDLGSAPIHVSPDASLSLWNPRLNSDLFDLARQFVHPADTIWDIGANVGLFTIAAAQKAGPSGSVLAIEPDPWLAALLERTVHAQPSTAAPIHIMQVAVSNQVGVETFHIARRNRASSHLSSIPEHSQAGGTRETLQVRCITLDWLLEQTPDQIPNQTPPPPTLVKIDVEGSELDLLHGAHRLLSEVRPIIMCESQHRNRPATTTIFHRYNYKLYDWNTNPRIEVQTAAFNTLAIPIQSPIQF
ncbi:MAG TPA: FkbM family methyltransferase [Edaphobacter sp.]|nr:FkbM family methyltransferase [Edaphobacter sp.]